MSDYNKNNNNKDPYSNLETVIEDTINVITSAIGSAARGASSAWNTARQEYFQNLHLKTDVPPKQQGTSSGWESPKTANRRRKKKLQIKRKGLSIGAALAISGGLLVAGCSMLEELLTRPVLFDFVLTSAFGIGSIAVFIAGLLSERLYKLACQYGRVIGRSPVYSLDSLAGILQKPRDKVQKDLEQLIEKDYLGKSAYLDYGSGRVVIDPDSIDSAPKETAGEKKEAPAAEPSDEYDVWLQKIKEANQNIDDRAVNLCVDRIHLYTEKIFEFIRQHPENIGQIRTFMNYYLPMTLKLLQSYDMLEEAGVAGENMRSTKQNIEETLETLAGAYRQQLDNLYSAQAMDISADIDVLEKMLRRDGLKNEDGFSSGTATEHRKKEI